MGPSLANIDGLLKMPYGCGEQNMLNFAPNIFIMQYLKATNQLKDEIKQKAVEYTLQGTDRRYSTNKMEIFCYSGVLEGL